MAEENKKTNGVSDNFKEALGYIGPRLISLLVGGSEGMNVTDKLLKGAEAERSSKYKTKVEAEEREYQRGHSEEQIELKRLRTKEADRRYEEGTIAKGKVHETAVGRLEEQKRYHGILEEDRDLRRSERERVRSLEEVGFFGKKPAVQKIVKQKAVLNDMEDILSEAPEIAVGVIPFKIAKGIAGEVGNLNVQELKMAQVSPSIIRDIKRKGAKWFQGALPEEDVKELRKIVKLLRKKKQGRLKNIADNFALSRKDLIKDPIFKDRLYSAHGLGMDKEQPQAEMINITFEGQTKRISVEEARKRGFIK